MLGAPLLPPTGGTTNGGCDASHERQRRPIIACVASLAFHRRALSNLPSRGPAAPNRLSLQAPGAPPLLLSAAGRPNCAAVDLVHSVCKCRCLALPRAPCQRCFGAAQQAAAAGISGSPRRLPTTRPSRRPPLRRRGSDAATLRGAPLALLVPGFGAARPAADQPHAAQLPAGAQRGAVARGGQSDTAGEGGGCGWWQGGPGCSAAACSRAVPACPHT